MRLSNELRSELLSRSRDLSQHADYLDEQVLGLLNEADGCKEKANAERGKAKEIMSLLDDAERAAGRCPDCGYPFESKINCANRLHRGA